MTGVRPVGVMTFVAVTQATSPLAVNAALCIDSESFERLGRVLRHLVVGLVDESISLRLLSPDPRVESLKLGPVQTHVHRSLTWPFAERAIRQAKEALAASPPTLVHAIGGGSFRLAAALAESFDADYVAHVSAVADCDALAEQDVGQLNAVQAVSEPLVSALETQLRIASDKVSLVRLGVKASTEVACYAHPERTPSILCTSAFERNRGVNHLIEAIGLLRDRGHTALAFLLGRGSSEKQLRKMVAERKLGPWITFAHPMGGLVEAMQSADIFVRPSVHTVVSAYPLQAMGAGMAVVTFASGVCDHFRHNETAIVCSEPTPKSLADGIEVLLANKQQAREMATRGVAYVREHHSMSGMAERTSALYRQLALARATFPIRE